MTVGTKEMTQGNDLVGSTNVFLRPSVPSIPSVPSLHSLYPLCTLYPLSPLYSLYPLCASITSCACSAPFVFYVPSTPSVLFSVP